MSTMMEYQGWSWLPYPSVLLVFDRRLANSGFSWQPSMARVEPRSPSFATKREVDEKTVQMMLK